MQQLSEIKGQRVLITGGAGFIGSHIVDRLSPDNDVTVLDNLFCGKMDNLKNSLDRIKFINGDIRDKELVKDAVGLADYIFHLAAHNGIIRSLEAPELNMDVNIGGMLNLLEVCRNLKIKRLVYSSSAAIYGQAKYTPVDEDHPHNPESPYAVSKLAAEKYAFAFHKVYGVPAVALRYFNIYGPRHDTSEYANVISTFLTRTMSGDPLTVYGDGEQTRDFVFVQDIVTANIQAACSPEAPGQAFNIATGEAASVNDVIQIIRDVSGSRSRVDYVPPRAGEIKHSLARIDKAKGLLGYRPQTSLAEGIRRTWDYLAGR